MADPRRESRVRPGLIPILVAMRVKAERDRRAAEAATKTAAPENRKAKKRGWFG